MKFPFQCTVIAFGAMLLTQLIGATESSSQDSTIQFFLRACVSSYAHAEIVESEVKSRGFSELHGTVASKYLDGASGRVWEGTIRSRRFAVALRPEALCSVIALDGSALEIKAAVESWLPPPGSGISVKRQVTSAPGGIETTVFELRGARVQERWVVTTSTDPASQMRAILSWSRL